MIWQNLTSPALARLDRSIPVLLPIAAVEQHGPHLPLGTDRFIADFLTQAIEQSIPNQVLLLPTQAVGCSRHHMDFPGTLTLTHDTMARLVLESLESVASHGFRNLVLFNSHGGNQGIGQVILESFGAAHPECQITFVTWWKIAAAALAEITTSGAGGVGHACEFETSLMLCLAPDLVEEDKIGPGQNTKTFAWAEGDMLRGPAAGLYRSMKQMTPNGVYGRPDQAAREKGFAIRDAVVGSMKTLLADLRRNP